MSLQSGQSGTDFRSGTDGLGEFFHPLYNRIFSPDSSFVADVESKLAQARMSDTVELYLSRALGIGVISGGSLWILGLIVGWALFATGLVEVGSVLGIPIGNEQLLELVIALRTPLLILFTGLVLGVTGFVLGFGALVAVPYSRASARKREINMLLTDSVSFMFALSVGGMNQLEIIESMAEAEDTYGEVAKEFQSIVQETEYFDVDYRTAIRKQAMETPSKELEQFLTDMLSIINSGGNMESFLHDKKEKHMRTAKQEQELTLETLELFGEMYMTLSLFPLLLIIILVIMQMIPNVPVDQNMIYLTVYALIPLTGIGFLVLVSTVKHDEPGDGFLRDSSDKRVDVGDGGGLLDLGLIEQFTGERNIFDRIKSREGTYETLQVLRYPHIFFRDNPLYTLALTGPAALAIIAIAMANGSAPLSVDEMIARPIWGTFIYGYLPLYMMCVPLAIFREWNVRTRNAVVSSLSEDLRKLSSSNDTGMTLLESLNSVAETTSGKLAREFEVMHTKVNYGTSLREALIEFNNKYHLPRLARTVKLITKAQEASNQISDVLRTAAQASENHDDIARDRISRTRMQVVIIIMTFVTLLAVMAILQTQFLDTMAGLDTGSDADTGGAGGGGAGDALADDGSFTVDTNLMSMLFFHAVTLQAILSGFIAGYIRSADLMSGLKYVIGLSTIALVGWAVIV